ncbi:MAG: aminotransferase class IV [Candidatus Latescibacterota bacterium]
MNEPMVYLNGEMIPASQAHINIYDAGIVLGATVTEMTRTFHHRPFRLEDHVARLFRSLKYVRFDVGMSEQEMTTTTERLIAHNTGLIGPEGELGIIHFVTAGEFRVYAGSAGGGGKVPPTVCIHSFPMPFHLWTESFGEEGIHVITPSTRHVPPQCIDPKMKYRSRLHFYLADQETHLVDPKAGTLMLDLDGNVTEMSGGNFLIVRDGTILSATTRNILPGISRQTVIELAGKMGIPFVERDIQVHDVVNADEAFETTTPLCLAPVTRINGIPIGNGKMGPITKQLLAAWSDLVGLDIVDQFRRAVKA